MAGGCTRVDGRKVPDGYQLIPPDGDWGWAVLGGVIITGLIIVVPTMCFGLLLKDILIIMDTTTATVTWIPSLSIAMSMFLAPLSAMICETYSCRTAAFIGSLLSSTGVFMSFFATRVEVLFFTYGILVGCGHGLCLNANFIVLSKYFRKYYGVVTGIALASYAFGRLIMTPIMQLVLEEYGVKGTFLIISALLLHICVGASLYRPATQYQLLVPIEDDEAAAAPEASSAPLKNGSAVPKYTNGTKVEASQLIDNRRGSKENGVGDEQLKLLPATAVNTMDKGKWIEMSPMTKEKNKVNVSVEDSKDLVDRKAMAKSDEEYRKCLPSALEVFGSIETIKPHRSMSQSTATDDYHHHKLSGCARWCRSTRCMAKLDFTILREPLFFIVCMGGVTSYVTAIYSNIFLPPVAAENHLKPMQGATLLSIRAGCEIIGRILSPTIQQRLGLPVRYTYMFFTVASASFLTIMVMLTSFTGMSIAGAVFGVVFGSQTGLSMVVIVHNLGAKRLSSALGLSQFIQGFAVLIIGPTIGYIRDEFGSYKICFFFLTAMQCVLALAWAMKPLAVRKEKPIADQTTTPCA